MGGILGPPGNEFNSWSRQRKSSPLTSFCILASDQLRWALQQFSRASQLFSRALAGSVPCAEEGKF